jgi:hypothetical protein
MGGGKDKDLIDKQYFLISNLIKRQSKCDFPRGTMRNGLIDRTKCQVWCMHGWAKILCN